MPAASYVKDGIWVVISQKSIRLALTCNNMDGVTTTALVSRPPLDIIRLPLTCSANGDYITLNAYYAYDSELNIEDNMVNNLRQDMNASSITLWKDFSDQIPQFNHTEIPKQIKALR